MLITVTLMLPVPTLLVASPAPVTRDLLEVEPHAQVSCSFFPENAITHYTSQILMSVLPIFTTVMKMLPVPTLLLVASPVPVMRDLLEVEPHAQVSCSLLLPENAIANYTMSSQILMSVLLVFTTVTLMLPVPTLLVASPAPVTRDTLELVALVQVNYIPEVDPGGFNTSTETPIVDDQLASYYSH
jgi:hypothetical protein